MNTQLTRQQKNEITTSQAILSRDQIDLLKRTICRKGTDDELRLFVSQCNRSGLDPFTGQIYASFRWDNDLKREVMKAQTGIEGLRLIAARTGEYEGTDGPYWCGKDGKLMELWLEDTLPVAAVSKVYRKGHKVPAAGKVLWKEFAQYKKDGTLTQMWAKMPVNQIGKCSEAQALRKAFPQELSGFYIPEEIRSEIQGDLVEQPPVDMVKKVAEKAAVEENVYLPDIEIEGWETLPLPKRILPPELKFRPLSISQICQDATITFKSGKAVKNGLWLVEYWAGNSKDEELQALAKKAIEMYSSAFEIEAEHSEPEKAAPSEPPESVKVGMGSEKK